MPKMEYSVDDSSRLATKSSASSGVSRTLLSKSLVTMSNSQGVDRRPRDVKLPGDLDRKGHVPSLTRSISEKGSLPPACPGAAGTGRTNAARSGSAPLRHPPIIYFTPWVGCHTYKYAI